MDVDVDGVVVELVEVGADVVGGTVVDVDVAGGVTMVVEVVAGGVTTVVEVDGGSGTTGTSDVDVVGSSDVVVLDVVVLDEVVLDEVVLESSGGGTAPEVGSGGNVSAPPSSPRARPPPGPWEHLSAGRRRRLPMRPRRRAHPTRRRLLSRPRSRRAAAAAGISAWASARSSPRLRGCRGAAATAEATFWRSPMGAATAVDARQRGHGVGSLAAGPDRSAERGRRRGSGDSPTEEVGDLLLERCASRRRS